MVLKVTFIQLDSIFGDLFTFLDSFGLVTQWGWAVQLTNNNGTAAKAACESQFDSPSEVALMPFGEGKPIKLFFIKKVFQFYRIKRNNKNQIETLLGYAESVRASRFPSAKASLSISVCFIRDTSSWIIWSPERAHHWKLACQFGLFVCAALTGDALSGKSQYAIRFRRALCIQVRTLDPKVWILIISPNLSRQRELPFSFFFRCALDLPWTASPDRVFLKSERTCHFVEPSKALWHVTFGQLGTKSHSTPFSLR